MRLYASDICRFAEKDVSFCIVFSELKVKLFDLLTLLHFTWHCCILHLNKQILNFLHLFFFPLFHFVSYHSSSCPQCVPTIPNHLTSTSTNHTCSSFAHLSSLVYLPWSLSAVPDFLLCLPAKTSHFLSAFLFTDLCLYPQCCLPAFAPWTPSLIVDLVNAVLTLPVLIQVFMSGPPPLDLCLPCLQFWFCCCVSVPIVLKDCEGLYWSRGAIKFLEIILSLVFSALPVNLELQACVGVLISQPKGKLGECRASTTVNSALGICLLAGWTLLDPDTLLRLCAA